MKNRLSIFLIILIVLTLFSGIMIVNADTYTVPCKGVDEKGNPCGSHTFDTALEKEAYMERYNFYWNNILEEQDDNDGVSVEDLLEFNINGKFKSLWSMAKSIYDLMMPVGVVLATIVILCEMMVYATSGNATADNIILYFIKLGASLLIILNGYQILEIIFEMCSYAYNGLAPNFSDFSNKEVKCFYDFYKDNFWLILILDKVVYTVYNIPIYITRLIITVISWVRIFMVLAYTAFLPIGITDMMTSGLQSSGVRYLKKIGSKLLQGAVIAGIYVAYKIIIETVSQIGNGWTSAGVTILMTIMLLVFVMSSEKISEEIVG